MRRPAVIWLGFALVLGLAAWALARLGSTALAAERAEARARRQAALEEDVQLALWRMDSALAPLIAEESARPYFTYSPLYPADRPFTTMFAGIRRGDRLTASPLLTFTSRQVRLHFQYGPDGRLSSPQVPDGPLRDLAGPRLVAPARVAEAEERLAELARRVGHRELAAALSAPGSDAMMADMNTVMNPPIAFGAQSNPGYSNEFAMRSRSAKMAQQQAVAPAVAPQVDAAPVSARSAVSQGPLQPIWVGSTLVLARRVRVAEGTFLQGCWLDWEVIRGELLGGVADLLPSARLEPAPPVAGGPAAARMLASLPVRLVPGPASEREPETLASAWSPVRLSLHVAWASLGFAAVAVALVLRGALALSERRGAFVSAVTHELRTPLTTFRLYTEMLDEGMVTSDDARRSYLKTLRSEAERLGHLVENVLSFARLERGRAAGHRETLTPAELFDRLTPRLTARAAQAGMELIGPVADGRSFVSVDVSLVDRVLSNLVDNAVKYAGDAPDRRIHLDAVPAGRWLALSVRDHGPGLAPDAVRRLFRPFSKSATDAAHSAPGVGLGLALSRRLARAGGGDLRLAENGPGGARFTLTIPAA